MASNGQQVLMNEALTATEVGESFNLPGRTDAHIATLIATGVNGATTVTAKIEHSPDGSNWFDLANFAGLAGVDGTELINVTNGVLPNVRANVTLAGAAQAATVKVSINYRERS